MEIMYSKQHFLKHATEMFRKKWSSIKRHKICPSEKFAELGHKPPRALKKQL